MHGFFRKGWDGSALLVRPSKTHHSIWKIIFVLGADEYLERLEGKIRKCLFFYVKIFKNNGVRLIKKFMNAPCSSVRATKVGWMVSLIWQDNNPSLSYPFCCCMHSEPKKRIPFGNPKRVSYSLWLIFEISSWSTYQVRKEFWKIINFIWKL